MHGPDENRVATGGKIIDSRTIDIIPYGTVRYNIYGRTYVGSTIDYGSTIYGKMY